MTDGATGASESTPGCYVLADDFTGACDTGVLFRAEGLRVKVDIEIPTVVPTVIGTTRTVRVILSDTRTMSSSDAADTVRHLGTLVRQSGCPRLYQKVDSTLRGNLGAEMEALLEATGRRVAVLCPAFPALGRTVHDGILFVNGVPILETQYARDPRNPIGANLMGEIARATAPQLTCRNVSIQELARALDDPGAAARLLCVDAASDEDLRQLAEMVKDRPDVLPVGAAGLGKALAAAWAPDLTRAPRAERMDVQHVIVASGSANPRSLTQLERLETVHPIHRLDNQALMGSAAADETDHAVEVLRTDPAHSPVAAVAVGAERMPHPPSSEPFERFIAHTVGKYLRRQRFEPSEVAIIVAGADTCASICRELGVTSLVPVQEVLPGIPWSVSDQGYHVISKAGGFGADDALLTAIEFCRQATSENHSSQPKEVMK